MSYNDFFKEAGGQLKKAFLEKEELLEKLKKEIETLQNANNEKLQEIEKLEQNLIQTLETLDKLREKEDEIQNDMPKLIKDIIDEIFKIRLSFKQEQEIKLKLLEYFEYLNKKYD